MSTPPVIIFLHVQKTAGSSFRQWLVEFFSGNVLFHRIPRLKIARSDNDLFENRGHVHSGATMSDLRKLFRTEGVSAFDGYSAIGGHCSFDYSFVSAIGEPKVICSAIRDPVERIVSLYNWARLNRHSPMNSCVIGCTLYESLKNKGPFYRESDNKQLNCIFGKRRGFLAKRRPNSHWTIVCKHHRYEMLIQRIADMYGRPVGEFPHRNRARAPYKDQVHSQPDYEEAVELIRKLNEEEIAFFDSADDLIEINPPG